MAGIPQHIDDDIAYHMDAIRAHFIKARITVVIRPDLGPGKEADVIKTDDDLAAVITTIERLRPPQKEG